MKTNPIKVAVGMALTAIASGCTHMPGVADGAGRIETAFRAPSVIDNYDAQFALGRYELGQKNPRAAITHFLRAVELRPGDMSALNALGVAYASDGKYEASVAMFREALRQASGTAYITSNLGFALMKAGRLDEAEAALRNAEQLDPTNVTTRENLALLHAARGQAEQGAIAAAAPAPVTATGATTSVPSVAAVGPTMVRVAPQVYVLQDASPAPRPPAESAPAAKQARTNPRPSSPVIAGLEVSNGAGSAGLARRAARGLESAGFKASHINNYKNFRQVNSRVEYRHGHRTDAQILRGALQVRTGLQRSAWLRNGVNLRLVLGRDFVGMRILASHSTLENATAAAPIEPAPAPALANVSEHAAVVAAVPIDGSAFVDLVALLRAGDGWRWI